MEYLERLIICIGLALGRPVDCVPSHVVAGSECEKTNRMLQHLAKVATNDKLDFESLVQRTLNGERPEGHAMQQKRSKARKSGGKDGGNVGAEADNKYNGLPQEQGDLVQRTLKIMRNIWLSSKSLQRFNQERHGMSKIGESVMILAKTLRLEGKYWQQDDNELSSKLASCANTIEPEVENGEKSEKTDDATEINKNFDPCYKRLISCKVRFTTH